MQASSIVTSHCNPMPSSLSPDGSSLQPNGSSLQPNSSSLQPNGCKASDVMVTSHGADMINALALHRGASVFEVMPVYQAGHI